MKIYIIYKTDIWDIRRVIGVANSMGEALEMIKVDEDSLVEDIKHKRTEITDIVGEILECI